jgi:Trans-aconitate methyltransferase
VSEPDLPLFYTDLARWWPLISPVEDYAEETAWVMTLLERAAVDVREVLELGSGGGHSAHYLKDRYALTLVDLSREMLDVSECLNPECTHLQGDMRAARLGRVFDAVFLHDGIDYMTSEDDLAAVFATAWQHCRPGGLVVAVPDHVRETFVAGEDVGGSDAPDGSGVRSWSDSS